MSPLIRSISSGRENWRDQPMKIQTARRIW